MANYLAGLNYVVQAKWPNKFYESIAAFNDMSVAQSYADDCRKANAQIYYRVFAVDRPHESSYRA